MGFPKIKVILYVNVKGNAKQEMTSSMFSYKGKKKLEKYPFFNSKKPYPYSALHNLPYDDVIEFFFNKQTFKEKMNIQEQTESPLLDTNSNNEDTTTTNDEKRRVKIDNFECMLRTLFPNGKLSSYRQSMFYYDSSFVPTSHRSFTLFSKRNNDYVNVNLNGKTYTVNDVVWLNDALNNPLYYDAIRAYKDYNTEVKTIKKSELEQNKKKEEILHEMCLDIFFRNDTVYKTYEYSRGIRDGVSSEIRERIEKIISDFQKQPAKSLSTLKNNSFATTGELTATNYSKISKETNTEIESVINEFSISSKLSSNKKTKLHMFYEVLLKNEHILKDKKKYPKLNQNIDNFKRSTSDLQADLTRFVNMYDLSDIKTVKTPYISSMIPYFTELNKIKDLFDVYEFVQMETITTLNDSQEKILKDKFPKFQILIDKLKILGKNRIIYNDMWKKVTEDLINYKEEKVKPKKEANNRKVLFEKSLQCMKNNESCKNMEKVGDYFHLGIEYVKEGTNMYEAYVRLNLLPGKFDDKVLKDVKCKYYDDIEKTHNRPEKNNDYLNFNFSFMNIKPSKNTKQTKKVKGGLKRNKQRINKYTRKNHYSS